MISGDTPQVSIYYRQRNYLRKFLKLYINPLILTGYYVPNAPVQTKSQVLKHNLKDRVTLSSTYSWD